MYILSSILEGLTALGEIFVLRWLSIALRSHLLSALLANYELELLWQSEDRKWNSKENSLQFKLRRQKMWWKREGEAISRVDAETIPVP